MILAIDPGTTESAYVILSEPPKPFVIFDKGKVDNDVLLGKINRTMGLNHFVIEMVASYGMAVGKTTFETVFWIGRFWQAAHHANILKCTRLYRKADICMYMCNTTRAKDANIRQALIDSYGEPGTKAAPGKLYGISKDMWSALAVGVTYRDRLDEPGDWGGN
jgi:hypothetical protein